MSATFQPLYALCLKFFLEINHKAWAEVLTLFKVTVYTEQLNQMKARAGCTVSLSHQLVVHLVLIISEQETLNAQT
jgi:hypothetical protein